jgi:hypothetical protein
MRHSLLIRFRAPDVPKALKTEAAARNLTSFALAEELIVEGLRLRRHALIVFRDGATGRRAGLVGGPDVWEVIAGLVGGEVRSAERTERAVEGLGLSPEQVSAALDYYTAFPEEIDSAIALNAADAAEAEALWRRRQQLLAGSS